MASEACNESQAIDLLPPRPRGPLARHHERAMRQRRVDTIIATSERTLVQLHQLVARAESGDAGAARAAQIKHRELRSALDTVKRLMSRRRRVRRRRPPATEWVVATRVSSRRERRARRTVRSTTSTSADEPPPTSVDDSEGEVRHAQ